MRGPEGSRSEEATQAPSIVPVLAYASLLTLAYHEAHDVLTNPYAYNDVEICVADKTPSEKPWGPADSIETTSGQVFAVGKMPLRTDSHLSADEIMAELEINTAYKVAWAFSSIDDAQIRIFDVQENLGPCTQTTTPNQSG